MELKLRLFLLLFSFFLINANLSLESKRNYISYQINAQETKEEPYIRQLVKKNGDIYIMASQKYNSTHYLRMIIIYDKKTSSSIKRIDYLTDFNLCGAESFFFGPNSDFIFTTTVISDNPAKGSYDAFNINKIITYVGVYDSYGYRRSLITAEPYYYMINLYSDYKTLHLRKFKFTFNSNNVPNMEIVKENKYQHYIYPKTKMISCDITNDKNYIFCAYLYAYQYTDPPDCWIFSYNNELEYKSMYPFVKFDNFNIDYFIKIVNLKDDKFFAIVSKDEKTAEFQYFKYDVNTNNYILIFQNNVENSQLTSHFDSNDIIAFPPDKIIKIYAGKKIIITIFQFYENDTILSIKIYNMNLFSGLINSSQIRINMLKNSILATYVGYENNIDPPKKGYFLINYPNSYDINLKEDIINIKDLIRLENSIFSLELYLKILSIPKDIILINVYNSLIINVGDELKSNDKIKLRQYEINKEYIIEFVAIARGTDSGYVEKKVYPNKNIGELKDNEVFCEGRKGKINIKFDSCLDGFYKFYHNMNLCSNVKPDNYYLDEKTKIFMPCQSPCKDCSGPIIDDTNMNCKSCQNNYYMTEDTNSCYDKIIDNYYLDGNILRRCHQNCKNCYSRQINETHMNCKSCQNNYYITEDSNSCYDKIIDNYYLDENILRRCHPRCSKCTGGFTEESMNCLECLDDGKIKYYYRKDINNCVLKEDFKEREYKEFTKINSKYFYIIISILLISIIISLLLCILGLKLKEEKIEQKNKEKIINNKEKDDKKKIELPEYKPIKLDGNKNDKNDEKDDKKKIELPEYKPIKLDVDKNDKNDKNDINDKNDEKDENGNSIN